MENKNVMYLPSGRIFLQDLDGFILECTEMRDVNIQGKNHYEVRNTLDPHVIWKHLVPYEDKWLLTVSTQKGCVHKCHFCDVADLGFKGNLTQDEIEEQIKTILSYSPYVNKSNKVKIGFARMGEPAHNLENVLNAIKRLPYLSNEMGKDFTWLPCFNSILPRKTIDKKSGFDVIDEVLEVKEKNYDGFLHFQISCNSTNEQMRKTLFDGADVLTIEEIIRYINDKNITNRTITLNFIVMKGIDINVQELKKMGINSQNFVVKLIPLNDTIKKQTKHLETVSNYENYEVLEGLGEEFNAIGVPTVIDAIAKCEEAGLCCGQLAQIFQ